MSGTSMDGIDAVLVDFSAARLQLIAIHNHDYSSGTRALLESALQLPDPLTADLGETDHAVGQAFADATNVLLQQAGMQPDAVVAIGSHGQTIHHAPNALQPCSLQIGNPEIIARQTGIDVVADFRRADIEAGGQGAPLVPAFHRAVFADSREDRAILNIGGIANITILPADPALAVTGFDTGPGNTLMDQWTNRQLGTAMDLCGDWGRQGTVNQEILAQLMRDDYFGAPPPKSTGREYFNLAWLESVLNGHPADAADIQATLCELTAFSIADAITQYAKTTQRLLVCGGGIHNTLLMERLTAVLPGMVIESTMDYGIDPDWVEAVAFAWLARQNLLGKTGNLPEVTGAHHAVILGRQYRRVT